MADPLKDTILAFVRKEYLEADDDTELGHGTPLISGGIVDSFSLVSLKLFLEKTFAIRIPDAKASPQAFDTIDRIAALVREFRPEA